MIMPYIEEQQTSADMISEFRGYNHNPVINENEFFDMENMTGDRYPLASTRDKRGVMDLDIDGVLCGIEGKGKPLVLWSDNANGIPQNVRNNLYAITIIGEGATIFDKAVTRESTETPGADTYAAISDVTASPDQGVAAVPVPFFHEIAGDDEHLSVRMQCKKYSYADITEAEELAEMSAFLVGKAVYLCGANYGSGIKMRTTPLHITGVSEYTTTSSYRWCDIYFAKSELEEQGIENLTGQAIVGEVGMSPVLMVRTADLIPMDKNIGGNGYIAFYNLDTKELENTTEIGTVSAGEKQLVSMGANVIVFPDKIIINTLKIENDEFSDIRSLQRSFSTGTYGVTAYAGAKNWNYTTAQSNFSKYGTVMPANPNDGDYFWDTSGEIIILKKYSASQDRWATVKTYLHVQLGNGHGFNAGDSVEIDMSQIQFQLPGEQKYFINEVADGNEIIMPCNFKGRLLTTGARGEIFRKIPDMDYIIESNNRLWGCRYGLNDDGEMINEIFASKLGDPFNWHYFTNTSIDSYYVSLGSEGAFTGAVNYQSTPTFFKSDIIHRIIGAYPAQYQLKTIEGYGVKPGCHKSISVMNDIVYYLSPVGMVVFNGGIPISLAEPFGEVKYKKCVSGDIGNKLYCSMQDENDKWSMFVYDDSNGLWHREDSLHAEDFGTYNGELLCVSRDKIYSLSGDYGTEEEDFEWFLRSGELGYRSPMKKSLNKLVLRIKLPIGSRARIEIMYDEDGIWRFVNELRPAKNVKSYAVPVFPQRCDHYAVRIKGKGDFDLQSITKFWNEGSEYN